MNIFKKLFHRREVIVTSMNISPYKELCNNIIEECRKGRLDFWDVKTLFRIFPFKSTTTPPIEANLDACVKALYTYCLHEAFIDEHITLDEFRNGKGVSDEDAPYWRKDSEK